MTFPFALIGIYLALGVVGLLHHEMWRDEVFPWQLAKESDSLIELFSNLRYAGPHFPTWYLMLWALTKFTHNLVAEQSVHLIAAVTAVWVFVRMSPFNWKQKMLFCFGYFALYEYCIICRMYVLVWLLMFLFCAMFASRQRTYLRLSVILFVLTNTTVVGTIMAVALTAGVAVEFALSRELRTNYERRQWDPVAGLSLVCIGVLLAVAQIMRMAEYLPSVTMAASGSGAHHILGRLAGAVQDVWRAYIPLPMSFPYWPGFNWGTNVFVDWFTHSGWVFVTLSLLIVIACSITLIRSPVSLCIWAVGLGLLLALQTTPFPVALRHSGFLFILYIACLWLESDPNGLRWSLPNWERLAERWRDPFLTGILAIHVVAGVYAWSADYQVPFSGSKATAAFIRANNWQHLLLVGAPCSEVLPVAAYLDGNIYYADNGRFGGFNLPTDTNHVSQQQVMQDAANMVFANNTDAVVILNQPFGLTKEGSSSPMTSGTVRVSHVLDTGATQTASLTVTGRFEGIVGGETYYLFLIRRD